MRPAFALAILSLALAGCVSPDAEEPIEGASVDAGTDATASSAPGGVAGSATTGEAMGANATTLQTFPVSFEGSTGRSACLPSGPNSCMGLPVPSGSENTFVELEYEGRATSAVLTLSWDAETPATSEMVLSLFAVRACGDSCWESDDSMFQAFAVGPSPLSISAAEIALAADERLVVHVSVNEPNPSASPVYASYSVPQAFSVEGTLGALVPQA